MKRATRATLAALAVAFALGHLPFLPSTLEDIDSVNFALGLRDFDVAEHRPHPPGYPVYIALGKAVRALTGPFTGAAPASAGDARALALLSLLGALAALPALYGLLSACGLSAGEPRDGSVETEQASPWRFDATAMAATALTAACPLFWYLAARPMSDVPGLAAALAALACFALAWSRQGPDASGDRRLTPRQTARSGRMIVLGALLCGLAIGVRSQNAVLTLPLFVAVLLDRIGRGFAGALLGSAVAFTAGCLVWAVPLVLASGGWNGYLAALGSQAGEDFAGVEMIALNPSPRLIGFGLLHTVVYPWDSLWLGGLVVVCAVVGAAALLRHRRRAFALVTIIVVPYSLFHLLFHDTTFVRYALPAVPFVAWLVVCGLEAVTRRAALPVTGALAVWAVSIAAPVLVAYARDGSPVARAVNAMNDAAARQAPGALGLHQTFRRPLEAESLSVAPQLPSPPRREWLELVKYWRDGHTAPVWFLADPLRTDLALIDPHSREDRREFQWSAASLSQMGGRRPAAAHWYRMPPPGWFVETGWALTPETAGMARLMGQGPSHQAITAWVRRREGAVSMLVGGRHLGAAEDPPIELLMSVGDVEVARWRASAGFFLQRIDLPRGSVRGDGLAPLNIRCECGPSAPGQRPIETAIEQFDLQDGRELLWGYDEGWHEAESTPALGVWRWASERSVLRVVNATGPIAVTLRVDPPRRYFDGDPLVRLRAGETVLAQTRFSHVDTWAVAVPYDVLQKADGRLTLETDRVFTPRERGDGDDQRRLGLRVFGLTVRPQD